MDEDLTVDCTLHQGASASAAGGGDSCFPTGPGLVITDMGTDVGIGRGECTDSVVVGAGVTDLECKEVGTKGLDKGHFYAYNEHCS